MLLMLNITSYRSLTQITPLDDLKLLACSGVAADSKTFSEYIQKNLKLYELDNDVSLGCPATASYIRGEVTSSSNWLHD